MAKMTDIALLDSPKLISRKIWVTEKSWNFHTVNIQWQGRGCRLNHKGGKTQQCGNLGIFLSLRFYVKSNTNEFRKHKMDILTVLEAQNHTFSERNEFREFEMAIFDSFRGLKFRSWKICAFFHGWNFAKFKSRASETVKTAVFWGSKKSNFDFT